MLLIANDVIGGYNKYINDQKNLKFGTCDVSYYQFDNTLETVYENTPIEFVKALDSNTFVPRGGTALLDAVGATIKRVGEQLSGLAEENRPDKVLVVIFTDGEENNSKIYMADAVNKLITHQTDKYKWEFTYIGANQNAWAVGASLGIKGGSNITYAANNIGTKRVFDSLSDQTSYMRFTKTAFSYSNDDIKKQKDAGASIDTNAVLDVLVKK
jgi:hypothetical protein